LIAIFFSPSFLRFYFTAVVSQIILWKKGIIVPE
jgi:hypothetical protein